MASIQNHQITEEQLSVAARSGAEGVPGVGRLALPDEEGVHVDGAVILEAVTGRDLAGHLEDGVLRLALGKVSK